MRFKIVTYEPFFEFLKFLRPYIHFVIISIPFAFVSSSIGGAIAYLMKPAMDEGFIEKNFDMLKIISVALVGLYILKGVSRVLSVYFLGYANQSVIRDVRIKLFEKLHTLSLDWFSRERSGVVMAKVLSDVQTMTSLSRILLSFLKDPLSIVILAAVALKMNFYLALISFFVIPVGFLPLRVFLAKIRTFISRSRVSFDSIAEQIRESTQGAKAIREFPISDIMLSKFGRNVSMYRRNVVRGLVFSELSPAVTEFFGAIGVGIVLIIGGYQVVTGKVTPGSFTAFVVATLSIWEPLKRFVNSLSGTQNLIPSMSRILGMLHVEPSVVQKDDAIRIEDFRESIEFKNVSFSYDSSKRVLEGVSLKINKGERVAIVGASGAGKSTLISLIPRFYDVTSGDVRIDGVNVKDLKIEDVRRLISIVDQEPFIFDDTAYNNILFGRPSASYEEVIESAKVAGAHDFVLSLPEGYDTILGERGATLSVGQCHRIAIARAVLKNAPILILDEPTASLDSETEKRIWEALKKIMNGKTVIVVSHRPSTVEWADRVVVLDMGELE